MLTIFRYITPSSYPLNFKPSLAAGNSHLLAMWGEEVSAPLHTYHFGFGLGTVIGPFMVGPFLSYNNTGNDTAHTLQKPSHRDIHVDPNTHIADNSTSSTRIQIPYGIGGGFGILAALVFFLFLFYGLRFPQQFRKQTTPNKSSSLKSVLSPGSCAGGNVVFGVQMMTLVVITFIVFVAGAVSLTTFMAPMAVDSLNFTKAEATTLVMVTNGCYATGITLLVHIY